MNKTNRLWIIIPLLALFVYSCKKEQEPMTNPVDQSLIEKSQQIIQRIEAFDAKLTGNFKSGETMSVDSMVWYTEALENYNHARPDLAFEDFHAGKTSYVLTLENGSLSIADAVAVYATMQADLANEIAALPGSDNYLKLTDVALDSIEGNTAYLSASRVFGINIAVLYDEFEEDDDWIWGAINHHNPPPGKCDGTMVGVSDGSDELERRLNNPNFAYDQPYVFVNLQTVWEITGITWQDELGNPMLFLKGSWEPDYSEDYCMTNQELTTNLANAHTILYSYEGQGGVRPSGKYLSNVEIDDTSIPWGYQSAILHLYNATYGDLVLRPIDD